MDDRVRQAVFIFERKRMLYIDYLAGVSATDPGRQHSLPGCIAKVTHEVPHYLRHGVHRPRRSMELGRWDALSRKAIHAIPFSDGYDTAAHDAA